MERPVSRTRKDGEGDILALCHPGQAWSPRLKADAIRDIESGLHNYYVPWPDGVRTAIRVVNDPRGKYLRTDNDNTSRINLDDLSDC